MAKLISTGETKEDAVLDTSLRPRRLDDYIGQDRIKGMSMAL